jgi:hypothetical protein
MSKNSMQNTLTVIKNTDYVGSVSLLGENKLESEKKDKELEII